MRSEFRAPVSVWSGFQGSGPSAAEPRWARRPTAATLVCGDTLTHPTWGRINKLGSLNAASHLFLITATSAPRGALLFATRCVFMFHHFFKKKSPPLIHLMLSTFPPISLGAHHLLSSACFLPVIHYSWCLHAHRARFLAFRLIRNVLFLFSPASLVFALSAALMSPGWRGPAV